MGVAALMGWTAELEGGPVRPADGSPVMRVHFAAFGLAPKRMWWAKVDPRPDPSPATQQGWALVGMEPGFGAPDPPWDEQVEYVLDEDRSTLERPPNWQPGEDEGHGIYVYAEP